MRNFDPANSEASPKGFGKYGGRALLSGALRVALVADEAAPARGVGGRPMMTYNNRNDHHTNHNIRDGETYPKRFLPEPFEAY